MKPFRASMFPSVVTRYPAVEAEDDDGCTATTWPTAAGGPLPCRVELPSGSAINARRLGMTHGQVEAEVNHTIYFPADPLVSVDDRLDWAGRSLMALGPARDESGAGVLYAVDCREIP